MKNFSRREFLKMGAGALAFLSELSISKEARAKLEEILAERAFIEEDYEKGLRRLRDDVFDKETESALLYVEKKERHGWIDIAQSASIDSGTFINIFPVLEDKDIGLMHFVHTHPIAILMADKEISGPEALDAKYARKGPFPIPPSATDIVTLALQKHFLRERGLPQRLEHSVLDPSGRWFYDADLNHPMAALFADKNDSMPDDASDEDKLIGTPMDSAISRLSMESLGYRDAFCKDRGVGMGRLKQYQDRMREEWGAEIRYEPYV